MSLDEDFLLAIRHVGKGEERFQEANTSEGKTYFVAKRTGTHYRLHRGNVFRWLITDAGEAYTWKWGNRYSNKWTRSPKRLERILRGYMVGVILAEKK